MIAISLLEENPPKSNPFEHDAYNMGTKVAENVMVMHPTHENQRTRYIIVVNIETGERLRVSF